MGYFNSEEVQTPGTPSQLTQLVSATERDMTLQTVVDGGFGQFEFFPFEPGLGWRAAELPTVLQAVILETVESYHVPSTKLRAM